MSQSGATWSGEGVTLEKMVYNSVLPLVSRKLTIKKDGVQFGITVAFKEIDH